MSVWLSRAGKWGEFERKLMQENRIYATCGDLDFDLSKRSDRGEPAEAMTGRYIDDNVKAYPPICGCARR